MSGTRVDFNSMFNRIATARARHDKEQREREIVEAAEVAKVGIDPLDFMPITDEGRRRFVILPDTELNYRPPAAGNDRSRSRTMNKKNLAQDAARIQRGFKRK